MHRRTAIITLVTAGIVALAFLPAVVTFGLGWLPLPHVQPVDGPPARDTTSLEAWTLFALFYLAWTVALTVLLVWSFDRIGYHWRHHERPPRPEKKQRRRARATMQAMSAEEKATYQAMRRREARDARRRQSRKAHDAGDER